MIKFLAAKATLIKILPIVTFLFSSLWVWLNLFLANVLFSSLEGAQAYFHLTVCRERLPYFWGPSVAFFPLVSKTKLSLIFSERGSVPDIQACSKGSRIRQVPSCHPDHFGQLENILSGSLPNSLARYYSNWYSQARRIIRVILLLSNCSILI